MNAYSITELLKIKEELRSDESRFNSVFENSPMGMLIVNCDGTILRFNRKVTEITGYTAEEIFEKTYFDLIHPDDLEKSTLYFKKLTSGEIDNYRLEKRYTHKDGHTIYAVLNGYMIEENNSQYMVAQIEDVTERKHSKKAFLESESRFRNLFNNAEVSIWNEDMSDIYEALNQLRLIGITDLRQYIKDEPQFAWDMATKVKVIHVNDATLKLFGAKAESEFLYQIDKTFGENAIEIFIEELCAIWQGKHVFRSESNFISLEGKHINALISFHIPDTAEGFKSIPVTIIDLTERKHMENKLKHMAAHDPLTGLYNRNVLEQRVNDEIERASRYKHTLAVFMLDLDHFKSINDTYGHLIGDTVLQNIAKILENSIRSTDYVARYGGEEFVVILPETPLPKAKELAERLRNQIAEYSFPLEGDNKLKITASIGIATYPKHAQVSQELLETADSAMYAAKEAGRNQVKIF